MNPPGVASRRRAPRRAVLVVALLALLAACVPPPADTTDQPLKEGGGTGTATEPVEIRVLANDAFARIWQQDLVPEFNEKFPHVKVTVDGVPYPDQLPKTLLELSGQTPIYDVVLADDPWLPQLAATGQLLDIKRDAIPGDDADYDWDDFAPAALETGQWEGRQYAVPVRSNLLLLFYNRALFAKAGVPEPDGDWTWDDFWAASERLVQDADGDEKPDSWAIGTYFIRDPLTPTVWQTMLDSEGGDLLDEDDRPAFAGPDGVRALQGQVRMVDYAPPGGSSYGFNEAIESFRQQKTAMMINWGSVYEGLVSEDGGTLRPDQVGLTTLPAGACCQGAHRGVWTAAIPRQTEHRDAATAFLRWMSSKSGERLTAERIGQFPARTSTLHSTPSQEWLRTVFAASLRGFDAAEKGRMWRPRLPESDAIQQILATQTSRAISGQASSTAALEEAERQVLELLRRKGRIE